MLIIINPNDGFLHFVGSYLFIYSKFPEIYIKFLIYYISHSSIKYEILNILKDGASLVILQTLLNYINSYLSEIV